MTENKTSLKYFFCRSQNGTPEGYSTSGSQ